ncbi:allantoate amidohydrolase [Thermomonospora amylolytica]|uniref:allantoate amidohydrolase n=1 Tax=Thermomonospora amylolytica TaxID=1411117 RepID=UPI0018E559D7|nr:allantoate amidohydrolase [Thermomonospora amylolytica]
MSFPEMWAELLPIGRDEATGGYRRFAWTPPELDCRAWFRDQARRRGLRLEADRNGNLFAWWDAGSGPAVLTGSHLDSVPGGGAFDGPLGVVSALAAIDELRAEGWTPGRPIGVAVFAEEEGARFGVACLGSRLLTGAIDPARARSLRDGDGRTFGEVVAEHGLDPDAIGPDEDLLGRIGCFVELHIEQGRALQSPVGVASAIIPHGRWRLDFTGAGDHAGTTRLADRRDPMLPFAHTVLAARGSAAAHDGVATVGKVTVVPGGVNAIPSHVTAWLDARGPGDDAVRRIVADTAEAARRAAADHGVTVELTEESYTGVVDFDHALRDRLARVVGTVTTARTETPERPDTTGERHVPRHTRRDSGPAEGRGCAPILPTGAGHDAGVLAARVPSAMLFVRNPTGVSHAPAEHAEPDDRLAGVAALAAVLKDLAAG